MSGRGAAGTRPALPRAIWLLGFVSLLMDVSSEMIHALLPVYMVGVLGASTLAVGAIEGVAEATASISKVFSGALSDRMGRRKPLAVLGYSLAAFTKPVFPLAGSLGWIVAARFVDRVGKGIRGAPRDALVADLTEPALRGAAFGLRQSLDTVGAFAGPLLAIALMAASGDNFTLVFWVAVVPALLSVGLLAAGVEEPDRRSADVGPARQKRFDWRAWRTLDRQFWTVVAVAGALTLARFSEAFLILRAQQLGLPVALAPLVLVAMNIVYALSAYPAGLMSDRLGRRGVLAVGVALLIAGDIALAAAGGLGPALVAGVVLWGLHMGLTQGLFAALVADAAPAALRGTAFGLFNLVTGVALLAASVVAGGLWDAIGPAATFVAGGAFAAAAGIGVAFIAPAAQQGRHA